MSKTTATLKINERVHYALKKKLVKNLGWQNMDVVNQRAYGNKQTILLFNLSLNDRIKGTCEYIPQDDFKYYWEEQKKFKKLEKRYGEYGKGGKRGKRAYNKFNKGRIYEEELPEEQAKFNKSTAIEFNNKLIKEKKRIKKLLKLIKSNPKKAVEILIKQLDRKLEFISKESNRVNSNIRKYNKVLS